MTEPVPEAPLDLEAVERFAGNLLTTFTAGMTTLMIDLADRTGLLDALATGPGTSTELAARTGLTERYVRECLAALATAEIVGYDARDGRFTLPPEHAACLTGPGSGNLAPIARLTTLLAPHVAGVARALREGGGVPYEAFRPEFTTVMDRMSRGLLDGQLLDGIVPQVDGLAARLAEGARAADVGCGTGHAVNLLARAFPASHVHRLRLRRRRDRRRPRRGHGAGAAQRLVRRPRRRDPAAGAAVRRRVRLRRDPRPGGSGRGAGRRASRPSPRTACS